jgi:anti-sigma factor ChrR (cupin superfamily)
MMGTRGRRLLHTVKRRLPFAARQPQQSDGLARLLQAVAEPPLRYAPFFDRLARLWDLDEPAVVRVLERSRDARAWRRGPLPGVRWISVRGGPKTAGLSVYLARFAPGLRFPRHRHPGPETVLVLEGGYSDSSGRVVSAGDIQEMAAGSEHALSVDGDATCIVAVRQSGMEVTNPIVRWLAKLSGS